MHLDDFIENDASHFKGFNTLPFMASFSIQRNAMAFLMALRTSGQRVKSVHSQSLCMVVA